MAERCKWVSRCRFLRAPASDVPCGDGFETLELHCVRNCTRLIIPEVRTEKSEMEPPINPKRCRIFPFLRNRWFLCNISYVVHPSPLSTLVFKHRSSSRFTPLFISRFGPDIVCATPHVAGIERPAGRLTDCKFLESCHNPRKTCPCEQATHVAHLGGGQPRERGAEHASPAHMDMCFFVLLLKQLRVCFAKWWFLEMRNIRPPVTAG